MVEVSKLMPSKRSELDNILRLLADCIDRYPDEDLAPIFRPAATFMHSAEPKKKSPAQKAGPQKCVK